MDNDGKSRAKIKRNPFCVRTDFRGVKEKMTQTDIGFDTGKLLWFIMSFTDNRIFLGQQLVKDGNIKLDRVLCDSYAWGPNVNGGESPTISHGRLRFSEGKVDIERSDAIAESIKITGMADKLQFMEFNPSIIRVQYNIPSMDWTLEMDGNKYVTMNLVGVLSGDLAKEKKRFVIEKPQSVLYSNAITIINSNLEIKPTSNSLNRCLTAPPS